MSAAALAARAPGWATKKTAELPMKATMRTIAVQRTRLGMVRWARQSRISGPNTRVASSQS